MDTSKIVQQIKEQAKELLNNKCNNNLTQDFEHNLKSVLASIFSKLDLVTREEFDVQQSVLAATRQKLEELELQVKELLDKNIEEHQELAHKNPLHKVKGKINN
jgi:BMFP domain-containing protein YqiC